GNCVQYETALELMETGIAGILVGVGPGAACTTRGVLGVGVPQVTATADVAAARDEHMRRGGMRVAVITDGGMRIGADVCKAFASGADAVMIGTPFAGAEESASKGFNWGMATPDPNLPRGTRVHVGTRATLKEILLGRAREASVYCELVPGTTPWDELKRRQPAGLILSGGPASVYEPGAPQVDPEALRAGVPVLGICYGMQLIAHHLGGKVDPGAAREYGPALLSVRQADGLFEGLDGELPVWMSHGDHVTQLPPGFHSLASSGNSPVAAFADDRGVYG